MGSVHHNYPTTEKALVLIEYGKDKLYVTMLDIMDLIGCSRKTAMRLSRRLANMNHELTFVDISLEENKLYIRMV